MSSEFLDFTNSRSYSATFLNNLNNNNSVTTRCYDSLGSSIADSLSSLIDGAKQKQFSTDTKLLSTTDSHIPVVVICEIKNYTCFGECKASGNKQHQSKQSRLFRAAAKKRKQLTLDSLGSESSRSRSPIVDTSSTTCATAFSLPPTGQQAGHAASGELISLQSFERRRSVYEQAAATSSISATSSLLARGEKEHNEDNSNKNLTRGASREGDRSIETSESSEQISLCCAQSEEERLTMIEASSGSLHTARANSRTPSQVSSSTLHQSRSQAADYPQQQQTNSNLHESNAELERARAHEAATGFEIVWLNLTYSVKPNIFEDPKWGKVNKLFHKQHRMILKGLSGGLRSGQMVALMGPSGAGKTCLLECIAGTRMTGIGGQIQIRGRKSAQLVIVPQYDDFMPQFSVQETIMYGSRLKNPPGTNHLIAADKVIQQLGLEICRYNNIQQCSGGQRKRVAIAQELVSKPNILILDEPTSGLDSSCCYQTIKVLRDVLDESVRGDQPMAIVTTIHQPSAKVFKMFDLIYLLSKMGFAAYSGPPDQLLPTIRQVTNLECPQYSNPSDYMIELVSYDYGQEPVEKLVQFEKEKAKLFISDYEKRTSSTSSGPYSSAAGPRGPQRTSPSSPGRGPNQFKKGPTAALKVAGSLKSSKSDTQLAKALTNEEFQLKKIISNSASANEALRHAKYKDNVSVSLRRATSTANARRRPFCWHTCVHIHRSFLQSIRDPILTNMRILIHLGFATLLVLLYGKKSGQARGCPPVLGLPSEITDPDNESMIDLADNVGYLFMCVMMITYVSLMSTVLTFPIDIKTVGKEYKNGWYGTLTYFLGRTIADLPFVIGYPILYCLITWYLTNQAQDHLWRYFSFTGLVIINAMNSQSFGLILGALFVNSVTAATFLGPVMTIPWYLFTGFTKRVHRLAEPYKSISKFLFTRHIFEGILDTVYGHQRCNCSQFLQSYYELRFEEAIRLGQLISAETLSSLDYYDSFESAASNSSGSQISAGGGWLEKTVDAASTVFANGDDLNLAGLMATNDKASSLFSFGLDFEPTCPADYKTFVVQDFRLGKNTANEAIVTTLIMLAVLRLLTYLVVTWKIKTRQL